MFFKDIVDYYKNPHYYIRADFPSGEFFAYPVSKKKRKKIDEILARQKQTENDLIQHVSDKIASEIVSELDKEIILDISTNLQSNRKLKARWSYEAEQDLKAVLDIDFAKELFAFYRQEQLALEEDLINQQLADGPDYGDGPEFAGYEYRIGPPEAERVEIIDSLEKTLGENDIVNYFRNKLFGQ